MGNAVMEHGFHSIILFVVLCLAMKFALGQSTEVACTRSAVLAAIAFVYMVVFGHKFPPGQINPSLRF